MFRRLGVTTITILAILFFANILCLAQAQPALTRHVREAVATGEAKLVGSLPATQSLHFDIVLPLRDRAGLENFLQEVYDPTTPFYHQFITPEDFTPRYGPSQEDWDGLVAFAKASGFEIVSGSRDAMDLRVIGTVANIEKAFHVIMGVYQHPVEDRTFYSPDREPTADLPFAIWHISGLNNYSKPHRMMESKYDYAKAHGIDPEEVLGPDATTGSCPSSSFCGSDMRAAYYQGTALTGAGQNIGLFEYYGYDIVDLNNYWTGAKQTSLSSKVTGISTDGTSLSCVYSACDDGEQILDMTQALGMAPGINGLYVYVGSTDTAIISAMTVTTDAPLSMQESCSWGWNPDDPGTLDPYFQKMASQGQNFFAASGDDKTWCSTQTSACYPWPADDANVVSVGGTDLTTTKAAGPWASETAWTDSGGGVTVDSIAIPSWQVPVDGCSGCSKTLRNGPDVSANANFTFYTCGDQKACQANVYGGTSFAAPMWAGYLALANQQAATNGETIGYINPIIYPAAEGASYATLFHDVTSGSCGHSAGTGFDLCTGWGSPNTTGLINLLAPAASISTTTVVSSSANPSVFGQTVTFTATVTAVSGTPTGTVQFMANSSVISGCSAVALSSGQATCTTSALSLGSNSIVATYSGGSGFSGSSGSLTQTVDQENTTTSVSSSLNPSGYGQSVSFTAHVTVVAPGTGTPTGTVQFTIDGSNFGSAVTLSSGSATSGSTSTLTEGTHTVTAVYSGSTDFVASTGTLSGGQGVTQATSTTTVASSQNPTVSGQSVTFTATINGEYGQIAQRKKAHPETPTGSVTWSTNTGCSTSSVSGNPGTATCITSALAVGTDTITATYSGDSNHGGSSGTLSGGQVVNQASSTTTVGSTLNPSTYGQSVSFTANVAAAAPGSGTPTGTVQFNVDGTAFGSPVTLASGSATSGSTSSLTAGTHTVTAVYSGTTNFTGSTGTLSGGQVVSQATSSTSVASSQNPSTFGQSVTFTATINGQYGLLAQRKGAHPKGAVGPTVTWSTNTGCGTTSVTGNPGTASCTTSSLPAGTDTITATYSGDSNHSGSTGTLSGGQVVNASPGIYSPANGSTLTGYSVTFQWGGYPGATAYWLDVGSTAGGNQYYQSGSLSGSTYSQTVSSLPVNGSTVYATWYYLLNGAWVSTGYTYTAFGGGSAIGVMTSPTPGSTLSGTTVTFNWSAGSSATAYWLDIGSSAGGNQYYQSGNMGNVLTKTVSGLPSNGSTVYVTLYSLVNGSWLSNSYTYTAYSAAAAGGVMQTPTPGSTLTGYSVTFTWTAGAGATSYWLDVGSNAGGNQYYQSGNLGNVQSTTVNSLPTDGSTVYVTLYSLIGGQWVPNAYTYTAYTASGAIAAMQAPTPGTTLSGNAATFTWSSDPSATGYWLDIGSSAGGNQYYQSGNLGTALTTTVSSLPADGSTIYATLYSLVGGQWLSNAYTYVSGP